MLNDPYFCSNLTTNNPNIVTMSTKKDPKLLDKVRRYLRLYNASITPGSSQGNILKYHIIPSNRTDFHVLYRSFPHEKKHYRSTESLEVQKHRLAFEHGGLWQGSASLIYKRLALCCNASGRAIIPFHFIVR